MWTRVQPLRTAEAVKFLPKETLTARCGLSFFENSAVIGFACRFPMW